MVNDKAVQAAAQDAINLQNPKNSKVSRLADALASIMYTRRTSTDSDDLAAADHYLNMRLVTAATGLPGMIVMTPLIYGYDFTKIALDYVVGRKLLQETDKPTSEPTARGREWAMRGLKDGMSDYYALAFSSNDLIVPSAP